MLAQLVIRDLAIIDRLTIEWDRGLTVLTGETGAGKSIIIDAVSAVLGGKVGPEMVRGGARRATVEAVLDLVESSGNLAASLAELDLELEDGALILARDIAGSGGRGAARINGRTVTAAILQQLGEQLVDIHGQSEHLSLLRPREHLELLDRYAELEPQRAEMAAVVAELRDLEARVRRLHDDVRQAVREQSLLRHEVDEIDRAELDSDEEAELSGSRQRLANVERLRALVVEALAALQGDDDRPGALDAIGSAQTATDRASRIDPALASVAEALTASAAQIEDAIRELGRYGGTIEDDPAQLAVVEERLLLLGDLKRKYGDSIPEILAYAERARQRLATVERQDELLSELSARRAELRQRAVETASKLSTARSAAAVHLAAQAEQELADLNMRGTRFVVQVSQRADAGGLGLSDGRAVAYDATGIDQVEFLIAANPGEEPRPLGRIASGGELARVSLALKSILSRVDRRPALIFDEVDVGVGGRSAPVVGEKLWALTRDHQVLCVTHMPQVAAFADTHLAVRKGGDDSTRVEVTALSAAERVEELAQMLGGPMGGEGARRNARELLKAAEAWKASRRANTA
jgi:DNA repair protein RecN (Recombination protein N)